MKKSLIIILILGVCACTKNDDTDTPVELYKKIIFESSDLKDKPYTRIPTVIIANNGNIIAACEKRKIIDDKGEMDIMAAISQNNGISFKKSILFENNIYNGRKMNPCFVIDRSGKHGYKGRIYCFVVAIHNNDKYGYQLDKREESTIYKYSDDNGLTWSQEFDITNKIPDNCIGFGSSPANGIQLPNGTLVIPAFVTILDKSYRSGIIFKTPEGDWEFSFIDKEQSYMDNECTIIAFPNENRLILNSRNGTAGIRNVYQSNPIIEGMKGENVNWEIHISNQFNVTGGSCQASLEVIPNNNRPIYIFTNPFYTSRSHICMFLSLDLINWSPYYFLTKSISAGYSVITYYDNKLWAIYESNSEITECEIQDLSPLIPLLPHFIGINN